PAAPRDRETERNDVPGFAGIFEAYRAGLAERDECDFDEQVYEAIRLLLADPELRARWQRRCRHLLVDEFQDLTPAYLLLLRLLASPGLNVFGVGDDDQTIYGYAGADPRFLLEYERLFPGAGSAALEVSYRCPPGVVTAVGHLLVNNRRRLPKTVRAASTEHANPAAADAPGAFRVVRVPDEAMAATAAGIVAGWRDEGVPDGGIVVLGRVNSMLLPVLAALDEAGVGTRCLLETSLLHRSLVRAALAWMRLALRPDSMDPRDLTEAARRPGRKINQVSRELLEGAWDLSLERLAALGARLNERQQESWNGFVADIEAGSRLVAGGCDSRRLVEFLMQQVGLGRAAGSLDSGRTRPDRATHADDLLALRRVAAVYSDPTEFHRQFTGLLRGASEVGDGVLLTSIHRVKGLEWDRVLVFAADETLMPHQLATDIEEERRVLHVAVTRARSEVLVLADESRPSRFLDELEGRPPKPDPPKPHPERPKLLEAIRGPKRPRSAKTRTPADDKPYDEALFETLRQWRLEESRRRQVPAYVVFDDRTLKGIARRKPTTDFDLSAVSGVGPKKMADYAEAVVAMVRAHRTGDPPPGPARQ
ncbi:MAG: ATP-dependent DNA helicase UvrD2, partial [Chloroflexi bacterium]|nr:ATP-dependent DNA helicase UvrD2 [Chloroflexota bacterium]